MLTLKISLLTHVSSFKLFKVFSIKHFEIGSIDKNRSSDRGHVRHFTQRKLYRYSMCGRTMIKTHICHVSLLQYTSVVLKMF